MARRRSRTINVAGKVALITGASRGLGLVLARELAAKGAHIAICARDEDEKDLAEAQKELAAYPIKWMAEQCDLTNKEEVEQMVERVKNELGEVEILINNAGIIQVGPMESMTGDDYRKAMDTHFWGPLHTVNAVLPAMKKRNAGRIVNISSINGKVAFPHLLPYTASKFALAGFSEGSTAELARHGIRVTSVYPGLMRTGSPRNIDVKGDHQAEYAWFKISDSLPGLSMGAEKAAAKIIDAMQAGDKVLAVGLPAKAAIAMEGIWPGLNLRLFGLLNRLLPKGQSQKTKKGRESESLVSKSFLTKKTREAAEQNNEMTTTQNS